MKKTNNKPHNINNIPETFLKDIDTEFYNTTHIIALQAKQKRLTDKGYYAQALNVAQQIEYLHDNAVAAVLQSAKQEYQDLNIKECQLPPEDEEFMRNAEIALFMACDIMRSCIIDMNDTLHRTDSTLHYETFNEMKKVYEMAKNKLSYLGAHSDYLQNEKWGDICDNMYQMLLNKAKTMRKNMLNKAKKANSTKKTNNIKKK